jgi:hypothetical protein
MSLLAKSSLVGFLITLSTILGWGAYHIAATIMLMRTEGSVGYDATSLKLRFMMIAIKAVATGILGGIAASFWLR